MASTVDEKLVKATKFPREFDQKVDMHKVNTEVMKKWIAGKISEILGDEDDVVIELCFNLLEGSRYPNIKHLQIQLTGFLDKDTPIFCKELWALCLSAQQNPQGVPKELLEAKKLELRQEKIEAQKAAAEAKRRREQDKARSAEADSVRQRQRSERGRFRPEAIRDTQTHDRSVRRNSRSPRRRHSPPRNADTYIPKDSRRRGERRPRRTTLHGIDDSVRSPLPYSSSSSARSVSPRERRYRSRHGHRARSWHRSRSRSASLRRTKHHLLSRSRSRSSSRSYQRTPPRHRGRSRSRSTSRARANDGSRGERPSMTRGPRSPTTKGLQNGLGSPHQRQKSRSGRMQPSRQETSISRSRSPAGPKSHLGYDTRWRRRTRSPPSDSRMNVDSHKDMSHEERPRGRAAGVRRSGSGNGVESRSPSGGRKRRRSLERYEPRMKKRHVRVLAEG